MTTHRPLVSVSAPQKLAITNYYPYLFTLAVWMGFWSQQSIRFRTFHSFVNDEHRFIINNHKNGRDSTILSPSFSYDSLSLPYGTSILQVGIISSSVGFVG